MYVHSQLPFTALVISWLRYYLQENGKLERTLAKKTLPTVTRRCQFSRVAIFITLIQFTKSRCSYVHALWNFIGHSILLNSSSGCVFTRKNNSSKKDGPSRIAFLYIHKQLFDILINASMSFQTWASRFRCCTFFIIIFFFFHETLWMSRKNVYSHLGYLPRTRVNGSICTAWGDVLRKSTREDAHDWKVCKSAITVKESLE